MMASVRQILQDTMLFQAARGVEVDPWQHQVERGNSIEFAEPDPGGSAQTTVEQRAIWHWRQAGGNPAEVTAVRAWPRSMGYAHGMTVLSSVTWLNPWITRNAGQSAIELPLTSTFLITRVHIGYGRVAGGHSMWPQRHEVDHSLASVFVYGVRSDGSLTVVPESVYNSDNFMPGCDPSSTGGSVPGGSRLTVTVPTHYVCVVTSLVMCKEKNDFEPAGVLWAGRAFPHTSLMSSQALHRVEAGVSLTRPLTSAHAAPNMDPRIRNILFTDTNESRLVLPIVGNVAPPYWNYIFDYYKVNDIAPNEEHVMVDRSLARRAIAGATQHLFVGGPYGMPPPAPAMSFLDYRPLQPASMASNHPDHVFVYMDVTFGKVAGQGAFDSIHWAPGMKAYPLLVSDPAYSSSAWRPWLESIPMAPFCEHDCLHTHWRWGESWQHAPDRIAPNKSLLGGFDARGRPYATIGAPMVPPNQDVRIKVISRSQFEYRGIASRVGRAEWQVFMYHGCAYSLFVDNSDSTIHGLKQLVAGNQKWPLVYWNMRWQATRTTPMERILVRDLRRCLG
jgi:hypothetical protein